MSDIFPDDYLIDCSVQAELLSEERWEVAIERAIRAFGGVVVDPESDEFTEGVAEQIKKMVFQDMCRELEADGIIENAGIDEDGDILWALTEKGAKGVSQRIEE